MAIGVIQPSQDNSLHHQKTEVQARYMICLRTHNEYNGRKLKSLDLWSCFRRLVPNDSELSEETFIPKGVDVWESGQITHLCPAVEKTL